ncbi:MAG: c-type cytochrome domain-containing protein [Verrucomicrobiales bacterium]
MKSIFLSLAIASVSLVVAQGADVDASKLPPASSKKDVTFEKDIKPIFEKSCFNCHGTEKQKAKLRVDSVAAIKKGSSNGDVIVIGKSEKSSLIHSVAGLIEDGLMPPEGKGDPLTKEQIGLLRAWIDQGAK